jgi:hypothetical protein
MAVDFPNSPSVNDEFTSGARTWIWNGSVWLLKQTINVEVGNLNDVTLTNLANGDALLYNSTSQEWENGAVDVQGAIDTANAYTDSAVSDLTNYIDGYLDPSTGTTTDYIDQQDAATLAAANAYTDAEIAAIPPVDLTGYATETYADQAEADAKAYADGLASNYDAAGSATTAESNANTYTDNLIGDATIDGTTGNTVADRIDAAVSGLVDSAPGVLDTLNELAAAINDDADFATTITTSISSGDAATLASAESYADQAELDAVATANAYTDAEIAAIPPVDLTGYATEAYVDTAESDAVSTANAYTDSALSGFDSLPDQTGQSGNYLTTDGSTASWAAIDIPSTTVAENAPAGAEEGDTWFKSSTGQYFVYYDTFWVEVGSGSSTVPLQYFYGLTYGSATGNLIIEYNSIDSSQPALAVSDYDDWFMTSHIQSSPLSFSIVDGHLIMESA